MTKPATIENPWPADSVERVPTASLTPFARNSKKHDDAQIAQLAASIREWGFTSPILRDETGMILAGHGRLAAAQRLGLETVPVITAAGWSEAKKRAYVIADNRLSEIGGGWDMDMLAVELGDLSTEGFDLDLTGFTDEDLAGMLGIDEADEGGSGDTGGIDYVEKYAVLVECDDEESQGRTFDDLQSRGYTCKVLVN